jgi:transposase
MPRFKQMPMHPNQVLLFGQTVDEALPADNDVRSFRDVMECLDYSDAESKCSSRGCPPYPPKEMVKILTYAYSKGLRSSRRIEELLKVDVRFIWLAGGLKPDHNTIARFRKDNSEELTQLFKDSVRVCMEAGLVLLNVVATDGTKIKAAASRASVYGKARLEREFAAVEKVMQEAEQVDAAEDEQYGSGNGNELPEHLQDPKERLARLQEIAKRLKESDRKTVVESDPDSRVMRTSDGTRPCYNLQTSVDAQSQVIVAMKVIAHEVDTGELPAMIEQVESNTGCSPDVSLADCGYCDEATVRWIAESNHEVLMPARTQYREAGRTDRFASKHFVADTDRDVLICPAGRELTFRVQGWYGAGTYRQYAAVGCKSCEFHRECVRSDRGSRRVNVSVMAAQRKRIADKIASDAGRKLFGLRKVTVEPVFGQMKSNRHFDRFITWGIEGACAEAALASIAHNVSKCAKKAIITAFAAAFRLLDRLRAYLKTGTAALQKPAGSWWRYALEAF